MHAALFTNIHAFILLLKIILVHGIEYCSDIPWTEMRLPTWVDPILYEIQIYPDLDKFTFDGTVKVYVNISEVETDLMILHKSSDLNVDLDMVELKTPDRAGDYRRKISHQSMKYCESTNQLAIKLTDKQTLASTVIFTFSFNGEITKDFVGLYKSEYTTEDGTTLTSVLTQMEGPHARRLIPCFDEPGFKSNYQVKIIRKPEHQALSNMELVYTHPYEGELVCDVFATSVKMSSYLFAMAVGQFESYNDSTPSGVSVTVYTNPGLINNAKFIADTAIKALTAYEDYFSIPYPLKKCDFLAAADFSNGAMENWGLIISRDEYILVDPARSTRVDLEYAAIVITHELAHQWFGNLVTMEWWNDLWLNEGFASLMEKEVTDKIYPEWKLMERKFYTDVAAYAMYLDGFKATHEIIADIQDPNEIEGAFDTIAYDKSACIIRMFQQLIGEDSFQKGLKDYFQEFAYKNAEGRDLWEALDNYMDKNDDRNLMDIADQWVSQPGIPYIQISWNEARTQVTLVQKGRFYYLEDEREPTEEQFWTIPATFITNLNSSHIEKFWLESGSAHILNFPEPIKWIKVNPQSYGYYHDFYSDDIYSSFASVFKNNPTDLSAQDRLSLLHCALVGVSAGYVKSSTVLDMIDAIRESGNKDLQPFRFMLQGLGTIQARTMYDREIFNDVEEYRRRLIEPLYQDSLWDLSDDLTTLLLQVLIIKEACSLKIPACVAVANHHFNAWLDDVSHEMHQDLKMIILATGIRDANKDTFEMVFQRYLETEQPVDKNNLQIVLGHTEKPELLQKYIDAVLDPNVFKGGSLDTVFAMVAGSKTVELAEMAWNFMKTNWEKVFERLENTPMLGLAIKSAIEIFVTEEKLQEVEAFFKDKNLGAEKSDYEQGIASIKLNIQWLRLNKNDIKNWFGQWNSQRTK